MFLGSKLASDFFSEYNVYVLIITVPDISHGFLPLIGSQSYYNVRNF